jgi:hypothetical protein
MPRQHETLVGRTLVQIDRAFWCIHEHAETLILLGLPTLLAMLGTAVVAVGVWQAWEFSAWINVLLIGGVAPMVLLLLFTFLPLPCAVFAWRRASGEVATVGECFAWCGRHTGQLLSVMVRLILLWLVSLIFLGLPLLVYWPRTCMAPLIALFEDEDGARIFRRSRRILREDNVVYVIGGIYLGILVVLSGMVFLPRLVLGTEMLGTHVLDAAWRRAILEYLWILEALSIAVVITALAMSWWIALTLLYHDIRWGREGEDLRQKILKLRGKILA